MAEVMRNLANVWPFGRNSAAVSLSDGQEQP